MPFSMENLQAYVNTFLSAQDMRKAQMNRMRGWLRDTLPKEEWKGKNRLKDREILKHPKLPNDQREFIGIIRGMEESAEQYMREEMELHPMWPWLSDIRGMGATLAALLFSAIGRPLDNFPSVLHIWSFCGLDGPHWRERGYNRDALRSVWLISDAFVRQPAEESVYRRIYVARKEYEVARPKCAKCTPPRRNRTTRKMEDNTTDFCWPGHSDAKARRYTGKMFVKDLWLEAMSMPRAMEMPQEDHSAA
tara:strand:- start:1084 stop:1830 length:747 start_codon:yes stop_codon:yes gene_type:complete